MKIYLITAGILSDYSILGAFLSKPEAEEQLPRYAGKAAIEEFKIQGELPKLIEQLLAEEKQRREDALHELTAESQRLGLGY
jgi:hypothetical protein